MMFILGYIVGLVTAVLIVATLTYFRRIIEQKSTIIEKQMANLGPRPKGFIVEPTGEAEESRQKIIEGNRKQGRPTSFSELE